MPFLSPVTGRLEITGSLGALRQALIRGNGEWPNELDSYDPAQGKAMEYPVPVLVLTACSPVWQHA